MVFRWFLTMADHYGQLDDIGPESPTSPLDVSGLESLEQVADVLDRVEDYHSVIPDIVTQNILQNAGLNTNDPQITRLISIAAQKFVSDIAFEALQHCKMRGGGKEQKKNKEGRKSEKFVLTLEDLSAALQDHGINVRKPQYYSN
jgi:transcription initiation factor TFIID subunit 10